MSEKINVQIMAIREVELTNMYDIIAVQRLAHDRQMWELVQYIEEFESDYIKC